MDGELLVWRLNYRWHTVLTTLLWWRPGWVPERWEYGWLHVMDVLLAPLFSRLDPGDDGSDVMTMLCEEWQQEVCERQRWPDRLEVARAQIARRERARAEFWGGDIETAYR